MKLLDALQQAEAMVEADPLIMGGVPVIAGSRIPIHMLSAMLADGASADEIAEGYPSLTPEQVRLVPVYVAAHPEPGQTPTRPWAQHPRRIVKVAWSHGSPAEDHDGR